MNNNKVTIRLNVRRFDTSEEPNIIKTVIELDKNSEYNAIKKKIEAICNVKPEDNKVIKVRSQNEVLVPYTFLLENTDENKYYYIDVCNINYLNKPTNLLQDAYIDSVHQKLKNMESRIIKVETLLPQIQWKRQTHMEDTVLGLLNKVSFLNRRIDELLPNQWNPKLPHSIT